MTAPDAVAERRTRLARVVANILRIDPGDVVPELLRQGVPSWDSLSHLQMIMALEEAFDVEFTTREAISIESVQDVLDLLQTKSST